MGLFSYRLSAKKWIQNTNTIGIISKLVDMVEHAHKGIDFINIQCKTSCIYCLISNIFQINHLSLSHAFRPSAWWNRWKVILFLIGVKAYYLSSMKISSFKGERWFSRYSTRTVYINISVRDVLYINDWRGCLLLSLSSSRCC